MNETRTVSEVARLSGTTVRTLHHYDRIGLLIPSERSDAGYRLYDRSDLARLQQILLYRSLGLGLAAIQTILAEPGFERATALQEQRELLTREAARIQRMINATDDALLAEERGIAMEPEDMFDVFGDFDPAEHDEAAAERWPGEAYDESKRRTASYGKEQWAEIQTESKDIGERFAAAMAGGVGAAQPQAMDIAEQHRFHIDRWFYACSPEMHRGLGDLYVLDARFTAYWDEFSAGLAGYVKEAIDANADRQAG